jgi:hypothetical protein
MKVGLSFKFAFFVWNGGKGAKKAQKSVIRTTFTHDNKKMMMMMVVKRKAWEQVNY